MLNTRMTLKTLIVASALTTVSASASDRFEATFGFSRTAPVEVTYAQFEADSTQHCKLDRAEVPSLYTRRKLARACSAALIEKAVLATQLEGLISHHRQMTAEPADEALLAAHN